MNFEHELLVRAKNLIFTKDGKSIRIYGVYAINSLKNATDPIDPSAKQFCSVGALRRILYEMTSQYPGRAHELIKAHEAAKSRLLRNTKIYSSFDRIHSLNDSEQDTTLLRVWDISIKEAS